MSDSKKLKKRHQQAATYTSNAFVWRDGKITLAKMDEPLPIRWSRPLPQGSTPSSVTVSKDAADRYFVSILVEEDIKHLPVSEACVGADPGLKSFVALSTGEIVSNPKFFARDEKKLAKAQTSKRCFACGHLLDSLPLDVREWICPECGVHHDHDINAANNIQAVGLTVLACGEAVRPGAVKTHPGKPR